MMLLSFQLRYNLKLYKDWALLTIFNKDKAN